MSEQPPPPGWYPQGNEQRYWDGTQWTDHRAPLQGQAVQPQAAQPQYAQPQYVQPQYGQPASKQNHTLRNVLLVLVGIGVLFVGGCLAVVVAAGDAVNDAVNESIAEDNEPGGPDNPLEITEGEGFAVNDFEYAAGWSIGQDPLGDVDIKGLKVTNNRDDKDSALVEIKFWNGSEVLALADCTTEPIAVGTTTSLSCFSVDKLPKSYDKVTINDTF